MHDGDASQERFAELYARAEAARTQAQACLREFIAIGQRFRELRHDLALARRRGELLTDLWLGPRRDGDAHYTAQARMVARLASMPVIEQAKGILMAQGGWSADEAFDALRQASQRRNIKLRVLAAQIVDSTLGSVPRPSGSAHQPRHSIDAVLAFADLRPAQAGSLTLPGLEATE